MAFAMTSTVTSSAKDTRQKDHGVGSSASVDMHGKDSVKDGDLWM